jgi:hypothetical protein
MNLVQSHSFNIQLLCACMPANATDPILTVKMKPFLSFRHGSKIVGHNADIPSHTTIFALTQAGGLRSCIGGGGSGYEWKTATISHLASCDSIF